jgi:hypothetical protein
MFVFSAIIRRSITQRQSRMSRMTVDIALGVAALPDLAAAWQIRAGAAAAAAAAGVASPRVGDIDGDVAVRRAVECRTVPVERLAAPASV